jgi:hypothetical protein
MGALASRGWVTPHLKTKETLDELDHIFEKS